MDAEELEYLRGRVRVLSRLGAMLAAGLREALALLNLVGKPDPAWRSEMVERLSDWEARRER